MTYLETKKDRIFDLFIYSDFKIYLAFLIITIPEPPIVFPAAPDTDPDGRRQRRCTDTLHP